VRLGREPADVAGLGEDLRGVDRPDPVDLPQGGRVLGEHLGQALLEVLEAGVETLELAEVVQRELLAGLPDRVAGPHRTAAVGPWSRSDAVSRRRE
jgi:hypothetical protein